MSDIKIAVDNDLPKELREQLSKAYLDGEASAGEFFKKLEPLFEDKPLSLDEVLVAWYMEYNKIHRRASMSARLNRLVDENKLEKEGRAIYKLPGN